MDYSIDDKITVTRLEFLNNSPESLAELVRARFLLKQVHSGYEVIDIAANGLKPWESPSKVEQVG